jgi:hypothetical protein
VEAHLLSPTPQKSRAAIRGESDPCYIPSAKPPRGSFYSTLLTILHSCDLRSAKEVDDGREEQPQIRFKAAMCCQRSHGSRWLNDSGPIPPTSHDIETAVRLFPIETSTRQDSSWIRSMLRNGLVDVVRPYLIRYGSGSIPRWSIRARAVLAAALQVNNIAHVFMGYFMITHAPVMEVIAPCQATK